jgi:replicative superfamily II helicase
MENIKNLLLTGGTGSGKTYHFFKKNKEGFVALFPCRQLCYEAFLSYGSRGYSIINGELNYSPKNSKGIFAVYESFNIKMLKDNKIVFIDEFHFINDEER